MNFRQKIRQKIRGVSWLLECYRFRGIKYPLWHLMLRPIRNVQGNMAWNRLTDEQRTEIHKEFLADAFERGYDGIIAHGAAWANEKYLRQENLVGSTVIAMGI